VSYSIKHSILRVLQLILNSMLTLYFKPTCAFCRRVQAVIDRMQLQVELKDIEADATFAEELMARGGSTQVPYLVDTEAGVEMYESDDIVSHLQTTYGKPVASSNRPRVHISDNACISCEG
jgi:glutaredoxin 3